MKLDHVSDTAFGFDDGTIWPRPDALGATIALADREADQVLRHYAAAFVSLVWQNKRRRDEIIRALRAASLAQEATAKK